MAKGFKRTRIRKRSKLRKYIYILIIVIMVLLYIWGQYYCHWDWLADLITTVIAIVAAVAFWLEYHENKLLNEAQFIMELNEQFLSDSNLSDVEWELEKYYNYYRKGELTEEYCLKFEKQYDLEKRERQYLVNYLVHLEGIAALINNGVIHLDAITNLMSYRYFIAMNNPIVRKLELLEYPDYYKGCIGIHDVWTKILLNEGVIPPMHSDDNDINNVLLNK